MRDTLEKLNIDKYDSAVNGIEAIVNTYKNQYDMIIMENEIPLVRGSEVACIIKNNLEIQIPIYICSTSDTIDICCSSGEICHDHIITKPVSSDDIINMLKLETAIE